MKIRLMAATQCLLQSTAGSYPNCVQRGGRNYTLAAIKTGLLLLSFSLFLFTAQSQTAHSKKKENFDVHKFQVKYISLPLPDHTITFSHISGITVIDARADTGRAGLMQKKVVGPVLTVLNDGIKNRSEQRVNKTPTFLKLNHGVEKDVTQFARSCLVFSGCDSLPVILMVIKKLWLSDELNLHDAQHTNENISRQFNKDYWTSGVDIKIEFYLQTGAACYPLYRYDSVLSETMTVSEYGPSFVAQALQSSLAKMQQVDRSIAAIQQRHSFTLQEIIEHNDSNFAVPALNDEVLWPGVYMVFDEFKNNHPSQVKFNLQKDKRTDIIYLKQPGGGEYVARDVWGYCDGKNVYIKAGDNFFLLQRIEKAFYIFGAKNIKWEEGQSYPSTAEPGNNSSYALPVYYKSSKWELQLKPFQLDWSTGMLY